MINNLRPLPNSVNKKQFVQMYFANNSLSDITQTAQEVMRDNRKDFNCLANSVHRGHFIFPSEFKILTENHFGFPQNYTIATFIKKPLPYTISKGQAHKLFDNSCGKKNVTNVIAEILIKNNRNKNLKCLRRPEFEKLLQLFGTPTGFYSDQEFKNL